MTRLGWTTLASGIALAAVGWLLKWPAAVVVGTGAVVLVAGALAYTIRRPRLAITREIQPARVQKGDRAIAYLELANRSARPLAAMEAVQPYGAGEIRARLPRLRRGERGMATYRLPTTARGVFAIGPIELTRGDPFGFARVTQRHAGTDELWVHPRVLGFAPHPSGIARSLEGPTSDTAPQGSITFHRLREYEVGDDLRLIHWKSTARAGQLMVRHNVDTSQPLTVVVCNLRPEGYSAETFETAVDVAASAVVAASATRGPVQLRTTDGARVGDANRADAGAILDRLTLVNATPAGSLRDLLVGMRRERGGTALVVVTGALDDAELTAAAALRGRFQRIVVVSLTPEPAPVRALAGVDIVQGTDGDSITQAWNLGTRR